MNALRISDLRIGDQVIVTWYRGQQPVRGEVISVIPHASRASGSHIRTSSGQTMRLKASMKILRAD